MAIALVLLDHFFNLSSVDSGRFGVDVFFVLSGMLMSNILFVKRSSLGTFYKRRISRIIPTFLLYVMVIYLWAYIFTRHLDLVGLFSTATFIRTYYPLSTGIWADSLPIGHLWSLNIEEHSYIIMSLMTLVFFFKKREWLMLIPLGLISILIYLIFYHYPTFAPRDFELRTESQISFIMLSAGYYLIRDRTKRFIRPWMLPVALLGAGLCYINGEGAWVYILAPLLLVFTVNHLAQAPETMLRWLSTKPMMMLGKWSYSLYLWQQPFYKAKGSFHIVGMPLLLALTVSVASFYLFESPIREYLNTKWR